MYTVHVYSSVFYTLISSTSDRNLELTDMSASCGHSWNQSIQVQLTIAGNLRLLILSVVPTGEKHKTTCEDIHINIKTYMYMYNKEDLSLHICIVATCIYCVFTVHVIYIGKFSNLPINFASKNCAHKFQKGATHKLCHYINAHNM